MRPTGVFVPRDFLVKNWTSSGLWGQKAGFDFINMPAGFIIPARHVPPLMARHTKAAAGYTTSSGLSLAQPNMAEGQFDMSQTADSEIAKLREEEFESKSGSDNVEGASGEDQDGERRPRKKRYHRHTQHQIQEMEM